jgi:hypothetical protein
LGELIYHLIKKGLYSALLYECEATLKFIHGIDKEEYLFDGIFYQGEETNGEEQEEGYESAENVIENEEDTSYKNKN